MTVDRARSVVFGETVEQYEAARADYPAELITDVLAYAPPGPALEVGAGTGKATAGFAARGVDLTCVEPDPRMAAALTAKCPDARVEIGVFEDYVPDRAFALLYSAQAWHWVDRERRWDLAHAALAPSGAVAVFWNRYAVTDPGLRAALAAVDDRYGLTGSTLNQNSPVSAGASAHQLADDPRFTDLEERHYTRTGWYEADRYLNLVRSISSYAILAPGTRDALLREVAGLLGDGVDMTFITDLALARRAG
ncbi:methyltransferase domain-containing protein [Nonomuraea sp. 3-1Str]|uniref:class I SAM-dependent methyltransferase n=1 Tax=Nonomuraea sp. 3-1Str TaxID=2929801 RepID=UPI002855805C|nr:methyltransferase domain-containing protein [Nonomuraea sp. 3-1Str]MDR8411111.1 methyltransferase domain-containing protein [Nonomuraea sp. 3-1Str]